MCWHRQRQGLSALLDSQEDLRRRRLRTVVLFHPDADLAGEIAEWLC
jgi:hypothetical protein